MMMKTLGLLGLLVLLTSCSEVGDGWFVLVGNAAYQRGDFQRASLDYLAVPKESRETSVVKYDLGNVYNALGEANTALAVWNTIDNKATDELLFRLAFNKGHLLYQKGIYQEAYDNFKQALTLKPASLDAKRNLELSLLKIQNYGNALPNRPAGMDAPPTPGPEARALLDYVHRLEGNQWKTPKGSADSASSQDW